MAKFDPEHAVVPKTDFTDRNSAERFIECGKFRRCSNLSLEEVRLEMFRLYLPVCSEARFTRAGAAQMMPLPVRGRPLRPITYTTVGHWAPALSCPHDCRGYRSLRWKNIRAMLVRPFRWLFPRDEGGRRGGTQENIESLAVTKAFSNGWVQGLGVAFLLAVAALLGAMLTHREIEPAAFGVATAGVLALVAFLVAVTSK